MSVKNAMNCVGKEGTLFIVFNGVGYYGNNSKLVTLEIPENIKNGMYSEPHSDLKIAEFSYRFL